MKCEKCGAVAADDVATCPDCGAPLAGADMHPAAVAPLKVTKGLRRRFVPVPDTIAVGGPGSPAQAPAQAPATAPAAPAAAKTARAPFVRPSWLMPAIVAVVAVVALAAVVAAIVFVVLPKFNQVSGPEGAVQRMMQGFAAYDGKMVLDNATHPSMTSTDALAFEKQLSDLKAAAGGKPYLKDLVIQPATYPDANNKDSARMQMSAQYLTDPAKGTYSLSNETITVVFKDNKWQVVLFQ